jgi:hypothetical protein
MGRKKRKADEAGSDSMPPPADLDLPPPPPSSSTVVSSSNSAVEIKVEDKKEGKPASGYAMASHGGEIIDEDIYVSDGSESDEEAEDVEMVLAGSRMGVMRRGIHHPLLVQPNRQWVRQDADAEAGNEEEDALKRKQEEEELAKLDPAQRAARLLVEKQRKLEEAKETARRMESEENAGRDPCLFSKRTAFDIRFDQIDDKPWTRGGGDMTDFFNYGLTEEDWADYSQQQLMIRQELTDASRQRRPPDPTVVPVIPRAPNKQTPKVAVASSGDDDEAEDNMEIDENAAVVGPVLVKTEDEGAKVENKSEGPDKVDAVPDVHVGAGGAWGAGAPPGSVLARLIEEQERKADGGMDNKKAPGGDRGQDMAMDSIYGPGSHADGGNQDSRGGGWNQDSQGHQNWDEQRGQSHHSQEWDNHQSKQGYQGQQDWNQHAGGSYGGGRGFRGGRGGRGGRGRGGRGFDQYDGRGRGRGRGRDSGFNGPGQQWGGRGDYQGRKRDRDDYGDNRGWSR